MPHRVGRFHYSAREVRCEWALREQTVPPLKLTLTFNSAPMMGTVCVKAPLHSSAPQASKPRPVRTWHMYTLSSRSPATSVGKHFKDTSAAQLLVWQCLVILFFIIKKKLQRLNATLTQNISLLEPINLFPVKLLPSPLIFTLWHMWGRKSGKKNPELENHYWLVFFDCRFC